MIIVQRAALAAALIYLFMCAEAAAQPREPIGPVAVDIRVALPRFKEDANVASALGVSSDNLPGRGLGLSGGVHWYPGRLGRVTIGLGGELLVAHGSNTPEPQDDTTAAGPTVNTRLTVLSPQLSLNFGSARGWSYLTAGLGWAGFVTERADDPVGDAPSHPLVLNYGGGARWFAKEHVAFTFDLRFYAISAQEATIARPAYPKMTMMVISAGVALK
jgi:hypothetical protein